MHKDTLRTTAAFLIAITLLISPAGIFSEPGFSAESAEGMNTLGAEQTRQLQQPAADDPAGANNPQAGAPEDDPNVIDDPEGEDDPDAIDDPQSEPSGDAPGSEDDPPSDEPSAEDPASGGSSLAPADPTVTDQLTDEPAPAGAGASAGASEPPAETEAISAQGAAKSTIVRVKKVLWAKHKYRIPQPKKGTCVTKWTTSNKRVAVVTSRGVVTGKNIGKAFIRGYDNKGNLRKVATVTVKLGRDYSLFIAHRGYCAAAPENTLPAFRNAVRAGFGGLELDVWESRTTSKKSKPCILVIHDKNLKHKTGKKMKSSKLNRKNRKKYKICRNVNGIKKYGPQMVPTIDEALKCIYTEAKKKKKKNFIVEIDVKNKLSDRSVKHIIRLVGKHRVHILCANQKTLKKFKKYRKYKSTEIWYCTGCNKAKKRMRNIRKAGQAGFDGISIPYRNMNVKTIRLAKSYRMKIGGYDISSAAAVQKWANLGCCRFNMHNRVFQ